MGNPCQSCGACCAAYKVTIRFDEIDDAFGGRVPASLTEPLTTAVACMRGTVDQPPRCIALRGSIGLSVSCAIYESRPESCRDFAPLAAMGRGDEACTEARRRHRMPPLESPA